MANLNQVNLMGNLTRDPELKFTPSGKAVAEIAIAINRNYTKANGEKGEEVTFVDLEAWEKTAETISKYVKKGDPIFVTGSLVMDSWDDKETGKKRTKMKVRINGFQFLPNGRRNDAEGGGAPEGHDEPSGTRAAPASTPRQSAPPAAGKKAAPAAPKGKPAPAADPDAEDDDIPF